MVRYRRHSSLSRRFYSLVEGCTAGDWYGGSGTVLGLPFRVYRSLPTRLCINLVTYQEVSLKGGIGNMYVARFFFDRTGQLFPKRRRIKQFKMYSYVEQAKDKTAFMGIRVMKKTCT